MRTVNFSDARNNLKELLDRVVADEDVAVITRRDADDVVVMSLKTWNSWKETEYLLASPANARRLLDSMSALDRGRRVYRELIEPAEDLAVHEPPPPPYRVHKAKAAAKPATAKRKKRG
ncbi:MAG TPA: type II toxin-antitoxin system prevent-host-death family antitoxin [Rhodanobacteraceae bacterium]|nr:type II toxin-antitoxin system prevent-host-death family antitoxin [Rhodanobacteraceae bacterium]